MSGYRRFIAYVYEYLNGKKSGNCGFIKVEVRDQQCQDGDTSSLSRTGRRDFL